MYRKIVFFLFVTLSSFLLFAQKDAPVAGHAATLVDLLKKDYSATDPSLRAEEIARDRSVVIAMFKSYLKENQKERLRSANFIIKNKQVADDLDKLNQLKKDLASYSSVATNLRTGEKFNDVTNELNGKSNSLQIAQKNYHALKAEVDGLEMDEVMVQYWNNTFLSDAIDLFRTKYRNLQTSEIDRYASVNNAASIQKAIPFIGGSLSFETFVDGLGRFLAKRIKEELTTYMMERVKRWLSNPDENDPLAEFKVLLPKTTAYLLAFDAGKITNFPNEIKQYIEDDLNHTLENAVNLRHTPRIRRLLENNPDLDFAFEALETVPNLAKVKYVTDYFTFLENSRNIGRWKADASAGSAKRNIANAIHLIGLLARSLVVIDNGEPRLAGVDFLTTYAQEPSFFMLYGGFLYQQSLKYYDVNFSDGVNGFALAEQLNGIVNGAATKFEGTKNFFAGILTKASRNAEKIFATATEIRKANKASQKVGADTVFTFIDAVVKFSEDLAADADELMAHLRTDYGLAVSIPAFSQTAKPYFGIAHTTNEIIHDLRKKRYATGILKIVGIPAQLTGNENANAFALVSKLAPPDYGNGAAHWAAFASELLKVPSGNAFSIEKKIMPSANAVLTDLYRMESFYRSNYPVNILVLGPIQTYKAICRDAVNSGTMPDAQATLLKAALASDGLRNLLVSYFLNTKLDDAFNALRTAMKAVEIKRPVPPHVRIFEDVEIDTLIGRINAYTAQASKFYFLKDDTAKAAAAQKREALTQLLVRYVAMLPAKFEGHLNSNLIALLHFINDMAASQDAADVEKAITAFALPSGSYSIKRKSTTNVSINSYPGLLLGGETSYKDGGTASAWSFGFTAPVGIAWSWGKKSGHSWGLFIPVIDIGAVTRLRLDDKNETQTLPDLSFKNILSPGLYVSYGFRNSPFSINAGFQYGPELKEIIPGKDARFYDSMRYGVGLVLDIPLINLHTKRD